MSWESWATAFANDTASKASVEQGMHTVLQGWHPQTLAHTS